MPFLASNDLSLPASLVLGAVVSVFYIVAFTRNRRGDIRVLDALIVAAIMATITAVTWPLLAKADAEAKQAVLLQNLSVIRQQIEIYKAQHGGALPVVYQGGFPQLAHATDARGLPGPAGGRFCFGPYLPGGVPANPYTGIAWVEPCDTFPPRQSKGTGGWLYHPLTGQVAPDLPQYLAAKHSAGR